MQRRTGKIIERNIRVERIQETGKMEERQEKGERGTKGVRDLGSKSQRRG